MPEHEVGFTDLYAVLECSPSTSAADLKRAYYEKVREFHPDKRPTSSTGVGQRVTQALNEAWEILQDPAKREAYDATWQSEKDRARSPQERAEALRHEGNELYKAAQALAKQSGPESLSAATTALQKYQAAIAKYSEGVELTPQDHRLRSNRALCYAALKDWARCREDAHRVTQLRQDFMKGWFLLAKALWREGAPVAAQRELDAGLRVLPGSSELLALQADLSEDLECCRRSGSDRLPELPRGRGGASRNVSPSYTPAAGSRVATPPPIRKSSRSPGPAAGRCDAPRPHGRQGSRSPGPQPRCAHEKSAEFGEGTANFGAPADVDSWGKMPYAAAAPAEYTSSAGCGPGGTFGPTPPVPMQEPPAPSGRPGAPENFTKQTTPPRRKGTTLAGMAANSRLPVGGAAKPGMAE